MLVRDRSALFSSPNPSHPWYRIWAATIFKPSESNYSALLEGFDPLSGAPHLWVFLGAAVAIGVPSMVGSFVRGSSELLLICGPFVFGIIGILAFLVTVGLIHFAATKMFSGQGEFPEVYFLASAIYAPLAIAIGIVGAVSVFASFIQLISSLIWAYQVALMLVAVKTVYKLSWLSAFAAVFPIFLGLWLCDRIAQ